MKTLLSSLLLLTSISAFANTNAGLESESGLGDIKLLDPSEVYEDQIYLYTEIVTEFVITREHINDIAESGNIFAEECRVDHMVAVSFVNAFNEKFIAVYSSDDECDGGNSMGVVYDENQDIVTTIFDSYFD